MEYDKADYPEETDNGYSDTQAALDIEIQSGGWKNLRKIKGFKSKSRQEKLFILYQAVCNNLYQLVGDYLRSLKGGVKEEKLLTEIQKLSIIQDIVLNSMLWEQEGKLEKDMIPQEVWELIE